MTLVREAVAQQDVSEKTLPFRVDETAIRKKVVNEFPDLLYLGEEGAGELARLYRNAVRRAKRAATKTADPSYTRKPLYSS